MGGNKKNMPLIGFAGLLILIAVISIFVLVFRSSAEQNLDKWLAVNQLILVGKEQRSLSETPFSYLSTSRDDKFFRIAVKTANGETKNGWIRASGKFSALLSQPVDVIWDK